MHLPDLPCFYVPEVEKTSEPQLMASEEAHHAVSVLRLKTGDSLLATNGKGLLAEARIEEATRKKLSFTVTNWLLVQDINPYSGVLLIGALRNRDRLEWLVEKCTEVGVNTILVTKTDRSGAHKINMARLNKTAISALKQSRKAFLPNIIEGRNLEEALAQVETKQKFIATCFGENTAHLNQTISHESACIAIGPEGDFTEEEVIKAENLGFKQCSLGEERFRSETAALFAVICHNLSNTRKNS